MVRRTFVVAGTATLVGIVALLALFAAGGTANAQADTGTSSGPRVDRYAGTITTLSSSGFTLDSGRGAIEVATSSMTWFVVRKAGRAQQGSLADLAAGDKVVAAGTSTAAGKLDALTVTEVNPRRAARRTVNKIADMAATIKSISGTTLTLTGKNGVREVQVATDANTIFVKDGFASLPALATGDHVYIVPRRPATQPTRQERASGATPAAAAVIVKGADDALALGVVQSVSGDTLTLRTLNGRATVTVAAGTGYRKVDAAGQPATNASLSDVTQGSRVLVYGSKVSADQRTISAEAVLLLPTGNAAP